MFSLLIFMPKVFPWFLYLYLCLWACSKLFFHKRAFVFIHVSLSFGPPERIMLLTSSIWAGVSNWDIKTETLVALVHDALAAAAAIVKKIRNRSNRFKKLQEDTCWMFVNSI
ncbi:hypothetical protein QS257_03890 [Terrilactibacillus sp. S3-3]|nr:hypothetical protein QS257_03890 [Terrilactibacillus sp. S3-3]